MFVRREKKWYFLFTLLMTTGNDIFATNNLKGIARIVNMIIR